MKKKISYLIILFLIYTSISHAQPKGKKTEIVNEISNQSILKYELEIDRLKNDVIAEKKRLDEKSIEFQKNLDNQKNDLVERMNLYLIFIGLVLSLVAWAINFFGKAAIKKRVEEIIENTDKNIVVTHSNSGEPNFVTKLNENITSDKFVVINKLNFAELSGLIKQSSLVVGVDTGFIFYINS